MKIKLAFLGLLFLHLLILAHLQFTAWPEMFSYSYLLNNGFKLYQDIALPYPPLLILLLTGVYKLFGYQLLTLQIFTYIIILISDTLIFFISRKILGQSYKSLLALFLYILLQPLTFGNMLWFDLATVPFILLSFLTIFYKRFFMVGFFWGIAFFIKQQTGLAILFLIIYFLNNKKFKELTNFLLGFGVVALLILAFVVPNGVFEDFLFWTIAVPLYWYPKLPGYTNWPTLPQLINVSLIFLPGVVLIAKNLKKFKDSKMLFLSFAGLFLVAFPRFDFFRFQPALATYIILLISIFKKENIKFLTLPLLLAILILIRNNLQNFNLPTRFYGPQEIILAEQIKERTLPNQRVYLLGVPSIEYVLSNRFPPKPWVDNYVWYMEIRGMQDKVIEGFEKDKPKVIFWKTPLMGNWYDLGTYQPKIIVEYIKSHFKKTGELNQEIEIWSQ